MHRFSKLSCALVGTFVFLSPLTAHAGVDTDITWTGGGDGTSWSDPLNWDLGVVPANSKGTTYNVFIDMNTTIEFDLDDPATITDLTLGPDQIININRGHTLTVLDDALIDGELNVQNSSFLAEAAGASFPVKPIDADLRLKTFGGGTISIAGTSFQTNETGDIIDAESGLIDLSSLTQFTITNVGGSPEHVITATGGGHVDLSNLSIVTNTSTDDPIVFRMRSGGTINLDSLVQTVSSGGPTRFDLDTTSFTLPMLQDGDDVDFLLPVSSSISLPAMITMTNSSFTLATGSTLDAPMLADITGSTINLEGGQTFISSTLFEFDNAAIYLAGGNSVNIGATSWTGSRIGDIFRADGPTTLLDLSTVETIDSIQVGGTPTRGIRAQAGGQIDLSSLHTVHVTGDILEFAMDSGGSIDLSGLANVTSTGGDSLTRVSTDADITLNTLANANRMELRSLAGATISAPVLTTFVNGEIDELGPSGTVNAPMLVDIRGTFISLDADDTLTTGVLTEIDDAKIHLTGGATANVVSEEYLYLTSQGSIHRFQATGSTTVLDLSSIESVESGAFASTVNFARATTGGTVDLSNLASISYTSSPNGFVNFRADSGGTINLSQLTHVNSGIPFFVAEDLGSSLDLSSFATNEQTVDLSLDGDVSCLLHGLGITVSGNSRVTTAGDITGRPSILLNGPVQINTAFESRFKVGQLKLTMTEEASFEAASTDVGAASPAVDSFEFGELTVNIAGASAGAEDIVIVFVDNIDNGNRAGDREAIYFTGFDGNDSIAALNGATLVLNGLDLYVQDTGAWINLQDGLPPLGPIPYKDGFIANRLESTLGDTNGDCVVDTIDLLALLIAWGSDDPVQDLDGDGIVAVPDLLLLLINWGIAC